jgi:conjugal transfer pilus assembly protein TraE
MDFAKQSQDIKELKRSNRALSMTVGGLVLGLLMSLVVTLNLVGAERTVLVPPNIDKTFWVTKEKASASYLEQMAGFVAWLILDVAPDSIEWKKNTLLNYVAPASQGALKTRQDLEAERLKTMNAVTSFHIEQLVSNEDRQSVVVHGRLSTRVNGLETSNDLKHYLVQFKYEGGRIHLISFKEIQHDDKDLAAAPVAADGGARAH